MAQRTQTDVVIVGSRIAGGAAAIAFARQGRSVVVLDRAKFPSETLSTHGCMSGHTVEFARLGVLDRLLALDPPKLKWIQFGDQTRRVVKQRMPANGGYDFGVCIHRSEMDMAFVETAREAGADVRHRHAVTDLIYDDGRVAGVRYRDMESKEEGELRAKLVVGADGRASSVAEMVGADEPYRASRNGRSFVFWYMDDPRAGTDWHHSFTLWRFGEAHTLTVGMPRGRMIVNLMCPNEKVAEARKDPEAVWEWALEQNPPFAERVEGATNRDKPLSTDRLTSFYRRSSGPGWALCGDAGHFKDPYIGQGIRDASRFGRLLGEQAAARLDEPAELDAALARWECQRDRETLSTYHWGNRDSCVEPVSDRLFAETLRSFSDDPSAELSTMFCRLRNPEHVLSPGRKALWLGRALARPGAPRRELLDHAARELRIDRDIWLEKRLDQFRATRRSASERPDTSSPERAQKARPPASRTAENAPREPAPAPA